MDQSDAQTPGAAWGEVASTAGYVLAVSYPVLALSTGVRAGYQLWPAFAELGSAAAPGLAGIGDVVWVYRASVMSAVASACYLTASVGFAYRRRWTWRLSAAVLGFETVLTLLVGTLSVFEPDLVGRTVWRWFGADYGFFPLVQPLLGLLWLAWPPTRQAYGFDEDTE